MVWRLTAAEASYSPLYACLMGPLTLTLSRRERGRRGLFPALLQKLGHQRSPSRLMAGTNAGAVVTVEIFVKQYEVTPVGVLLKRLRPAVDGPAPVRIRQEETRQPTRQLCGYLPEGRLVLGAGRQWDQQAITVEVVQLLQRLDEQV